MSADNDTPNENENPAPDAAAPADAGNEVAALREEVAALKDRLLRSMADAENMRKRAERERNDAAQYGMARFARDLLSVSDNLSRALAALPEEARAQANDALRGVIEGVEATERELQSVLGRHGVKRIEAEGARFDPNLHQAIAEVPSAGAPGTVVTVVQTGYTIGERLLRPAMVTVSRGGAGASGSNGNGVDKTV
jgi:molecular chaperone GrpE